MLQKGVEYNQKLNCSLRYLHLTGKFFRVSLWLKSLKIKGRSLVLMKLQACNLVKDIFVTPSKKVFKGFE